MIYKSFTFFYAALLLVAQMAVESLCKKTPYFVEGKKRPQEALFTLYKIRCFLKSL
jgi:hypothetical protein